MNIRGARKCLSYKNNLLQWTPPNFGGIHWRSEVREQKWTDGSSLHFLWINVYCVNII